MKPDCHIPECGYPKGECAGTCGSYRKHVKPYPNTVDDLPAPGVDFSPEEYRKDAIRTMAWIAVWIAALLAVVFTLSVIAGFVSAK